MAVILSAHQLTKAFAARPLFSGLTFAIQDGERIGLIGPNGAGKSTLLRILAGQLNPDSGALSPRRGLRVGFLEQVPQFASGATLLSTVLEGASARADAPADHWEEVAAARELISRLELDGLSENQALSQLSGGWKKRVALARELLKKPDLLLLDEPTNHLDVESILWLEKFLARAPFTVLTVTHDRFFLQRVSNRIIELDPRHSGGLLSVQGDYQAYLTIREQLILAQEKREVILKNTLRRETEWLRQGAKARTTKQQARIARAHELMRDVDDLTSRNQVRVAQLDFQSSERNPKKLIEAKGISKKYDGKTVFSGVSLLITPGARLGLLGRNGSGKSTLIRVLIGKEAPDSGEVFRSDQLAVAYFDQTRETLDPETTVLRTLCPSGEYVDYRGARVHIRSYLDRFLFSQGQMEMAVGKLSGGEQSRLLIARLMLTQANVLVLDEPTNDLDMATLGVLEDCLSDFAGAVILVTHDRYFLDQVTDRILAFPPPGAAPEGTLLPFVGVEQWESWLLQQQRDSQTRARSVAARSSGETVANAGAGSDTAAAPKKRKLSFNEQRELDRMETTIHDAETRLNRLTDESTLPENLSNAVVLAKITAEMAALQAEVDRLYRRWAELSGE